MDFNKDILNKYLSGNCSEKERILVEHWIDQLNIDKEGAVGEDQVNRHLKSLDTRIIAEKSIKSLSWRWIASIAASVAFILSFAIYQGWIFVVKEPVLVLSDITAPISSNAIVVLEDNSEYNLDSLSKGDTLKADGYLITKLSTGELHYIPTSNREALVYNTLRTKSGGLAQIKLSDGTTVWLNANSELRYPIHFSKDMRIVDLKGEAYFEVSPASSNHGSAFYVKGDEEVIKVFGTKFNAEFRDRYQVALLEGSVGLANQAGGAENFNTLSFSTKLSPNQVFNGENVEYSDNIERYIDWKEGYFDLYGLTISELTIKLSNWYGVEFEVDKSIQHHQLFGRISRYKGLKDVLELVSRVTPIKYAIKANKIEILKTN